MLIGWLRCAVVSTFRLPPSLACFLSFCSRVRPRRPFFRTDIVVVGEALTRSSASFDCLLFTRSPSPVHKRRGGSSVSYLYASNYAKRRRNAIAAVNKERMEWASERVSCLLWGNFDLADRERGETDETRDGDADCATSSENHLLLPPPPPPLLSGVAEWRGRQCNYRSCRRRRQRRQRRYGTTTRTASASGQGESD